MIIQDEPLDNLVKYKIFWGTLQIESFERDLKEFNPYNIGYKIQRFKHVFEVTKVISIRIRNTKHIHVFTKTLTR